MDYIIFSLINLHMIPHNDKAKPVLFKFYKMLQILFISISIQALCYETRNWAQVHPVSIDHLWDVSTTWLESTCGKLNWLDMIWKGTHLYIRSHSLCQSKNEAMRSKELSVELRNRMLSRHRFEEGYQNISAALKVPKNTVASIILKWKKFGTTKTLPRAGRLAKLSNRREGPWSGRWPRTRWSLWQSSRVPLSRWLYFWKILPSL